jgi:versiconal hemiacetal acetate esterase
VDRCKIFYHERYAAHADLNKFTKTASLHPTPGSIQEYRELKRLRSDAAQEFLKKPGFEALDEKVAVRNTRITLPTVPGHAFGLRTYRPAHIADDVLLPVELYFHGGFWVAGDADSEDLGCRAIIAHGNDVTILSFEYRLIPEVDWQTLFSDAENAVKWAAANAREYGGDVKKGFIVGGAEAGAHLAAISAIRVRDLPHVRLTGQNLIVPTTIAWPDPEIPVAWQERLCSHKENTDAPILSEKLYESFVSALKIPDSEKRRGENFPVWARLDDLPPAYLAMDECDPIRDQGFLYNDLLTAAGVKTRLDYYEGLPNMFVQFLGLPTTLIAGTHLAAGHAWLLQEKS